MKKTIATFSTKMLPYAGAALTGLVLSNAAWADSIRQSWNGNGHFYQRFDRLETWGNAKQHCESLGAHLATITSSDEQKFIQDKFLADQSIDYYFFLGGTDAASQYNWKWITGEAWIYTNWQSGQPDNNTNEDYLAIRGFAYNGYSHNYKWHDVYIDDTLQGHICEWSTNNFVGTTVVPDLNGNGVDEIAALWVAYQTGKHTVQIKDPASKAIISTLTFATNFKPPQGVVALADLNGNGVPEIGVLFNNGGPAVQIKDAKNNNKVLKTLNFLGGQYAPKAVNVVPDANGNGFSEIIVLGSNKNTGKGKSEIRDSKTDTVLDAVGF